MRSCPIAPIARLALAAALALVSALPAPVAAQTGASGSFALVGATVHTGTGEVLEGATVVVRDGLIAAVGTGVSVPAGVRTIDAAGRVVTAGFLDSMTRLGLVEVGAVSETRDFATDFDRITASFDVVDGLDPMSTLLAVTRRGGITRAVVAPTSGASLIAGRGALVDLGVGSTPTTLDVQPMVQLRHAALFARLGAGGARLAGGARAAALVVLREALADARDYAAHREAFQQGARREYALSRLDLEALVPVVRGELPVVIAVDRASDILAALRFAQEEAIRVILAGVADGWMVADRIAASGVPVLVDPMANLPSFDGLAASLENAARLHAAGATVAFASFDAHNARNLRQAAGNAVAYGFPHQAALAAVTRVPAEIWGLDDRYGTVEAGKEADLVVWSGDPFELLTTVEHVFVEGVEMPLESRQQELFERYRKLDGERPVAYDQEP